jgi:hypothetical protein
MYKYILGKVSFDKNIFKKELNKALTSLEYNDCISLLRWCRITFDEQLVKELELEE